MTTNNTNDPSLQDMCDWLNKRAATGKYKIFDGRIMYSRPLLGATLHNLIPIPDIMERMRVENKAPNPERSVATDAK